MIESRSRLHSPGCIHPLWLLCGERTLASSQEGTRKCTTERGVRPRGWGRCLLGPTPAGAPGTEEMNPVFPLCCTWSPHWSEAPPRHPQALLPPEAHQGRF